MMVFCHPSRWWVRDVVHFLVMWVLLDVEVVVVINLIISVVDKAIWIIVMMIFVIFRVCEPVFILFPIVMPLMCSMSRHWLEFELWKRHLGSRPLNSLVVMHEWQFVLVMVVDVVVPI